MNLNQGELVLVRYPFSNQIDYKIRPALIISNDLFNKKNDPWVCPVSSKNKIDYIEITNSLFSGNLNKNSFVKTNAITFLDSNLILKKIDSIKKDKLNQIIKKIISNF